jgi:hypothetical protein
MRLIYASLIFIVLLGACKFPHRLGPSDVSDAPQSEAREHLRQNLSDLSFLPTAPAGWRIAELIRAPIYSGSFDVVTLLVRSDCSALTDTCLKQLRLYSWDTSKHQYGVRDSLLSRSIYDISTYDLTHDGRQDLIASSLTHPRKHQGLQILGITQATNVLISRYQSDTIVPSITRLTGRNFCLIEYDSLYAKRVTGLAIRVPKRYYRTSGEFFLEAPSDTSWALVLQRFRDSTNQMYLLSREEMKNQARPDASLQKAFLSSVIANALLDTSWQSAQSSLQHILTDYATKLSTASYNTLLHFSLMNRVGGFVHQGQRLSAGVIGLIGDLDDAYAINDTIRIRSSMMQLLRAGVSVDILIRAANAAISHTIAPSESNALLVRALELAPRNVTALRLRAHLFDLRGMGDSSRELLVRSLQYDSLSTEALRIRQQLGYY